MARTLHVGDLVAPRERAQGHPEALEREAGIVVELRPSDCRIFSPQTGRSYWMDRDQLAQLRIVAGPRTVLASCHHLLRRLEATECELHPLPDGVFHLDITHAGLDLPLLDEIRDYLKEDLISLQVEPHGMGAIRTSIRFR